MGNPYDPQYPYGAPQPGAQPDPLQPYMYQQQFQQQAYAHQVAYVAQPQSGAATASLVLGIIGLLGGWCVLGVPCVLAVVFGHIGLAQTSDGMTQGRGMAIAGLVMGYLFVIPAIIIFLAFVVAVA